MESSDYVNSGSVPSELAEMIEESDSMNLLIAGVLTRARQIARDFGLDRDGDDLSEYLGFLLAETGKNLPEVNLVHVGELRRSSYDGDGFSTTVTIEQL